MGEGKASLKQYIKTVCEREISFADNNILRDLFGEHDSNIQLIQKLEDVNISLRENRISITGDQLAVNLIQNLVMQLYAILEKGYPIYPADIDYAHRILSSNNSVNLEKIFMDTVFISSKKRIITPKSIIQKLYIDSIRHYDMVFAIGPAGTGKTYLAMAMAISALLDKKVSRIVLTRPAVEAGEKLGFLPGDLSEKVNPYLRPLYDALYDMIDFDKASALIHKGVIEVAPLAFMRGRTLNDAFVILDEAQNTVITGDITQIDLPSDKVPGLIEAEKILQKVEGIRFVHFSEIDVVRHPLVQDVIRAYNHLDRGKRKKRKQ